MTQTEVDELTAELIKLKEYIFVLDTVDDHMVPVIVAHAVLSAHKQFENLSMYRHWLRESYKKCVCKVNQAEMNKIVKEKHVSLTTERNYGMTIVAAVLCPRFEYTNVVKYAKLWKPKWQ